MAENAPLAPLPNGALSVQKGKVMDYYEASSKNWLISRNGSRFFSNDYAAFLCRRAALYLRRTHGRIAALEHMFPVGTTRVTQDVKDWLIGKGFLAAPYSFHQLSMRYDGSLFDHAFNTATALQVITRNSGMRWERPESPLIVGMFSELYRLDWYDDADTCAGVTANTRNFRSRVKNVSPIRGWTDKSIMMLSTQFRLTEEEVYCILFSHEDSDNDNATGDFMDAVKKYPNVLFTYTASTYASCCLDGEIPA